MSADLPGRIRRAGATPSPDFDPAAAVRRGVRLHRRRRVARAAAATACLALVALVTTPEVSDRVLLDPSPQPAPLATPGPRPTPTPTAAPARCGTLDDGPVLAALRQHLRGAGALEMGPIATAPVPKSEGAVYLAARIEGPGDQQSVATWVTDSLDEVRLDPGPGAPSLPDVERLLETQTHELPRFAAIWSVDEPARELSTWRPAADPSNPHPPSPAARGRAVSCVGANPIPSPTAAMADGDWEPADGLRLSPAGKVSLIWTGAEVLVISGGGRPSEPQVGSRYNPATGVVAPLGPELQQWIGGYPLAWTGTEVIGGSLAGLQAYDPANDQLRTLPTAPALTDLTPFPPYDIVQWTGSELLVWSGEQGSAGVAFHPARESWRLLAPLPLSSRSRPAVAWTGRQLVVWGGCDLSPQCDDFPTGTDELRDGATYDVAADGWTPLPDGPLAARDRPQAAWTGQEVVFWGGDVPDGPDGDYAAAYDPADRTWRAVRDGPLPPRSDHAMVWSGDRLLVWGGAVGVDLLRRDGAAYDPQTDRWTTLADAPVAGYAGDSAVWTGREMVVAVSSDRGRTAAVYRP